jgi:tripartite-type tricarboxylate transporter receptor subunit TctC
LTKIGFAVKKILFVVLFLISNLFFVSIIKAADYPVKIVKIIAPVSPGGGVDLVARTIADSLTRSWSKFYHR